QLRATGRADLSRAGAPAVVSARRHGVQRVLRQLRRARGAAPVAGLPGSGRAGSTGQASLAATGGTGAADTGTPGHAVCVRAAASGAAPSQTGRIHAPAAGLSSAA